MLFSLKKAADKGSAAGERMFFRCAGFPQSAVCISVAQLCLGRMQRQPGGKPKKTKADFDLAGSTFRKKGKPDKTAGNPIFLF